MSDPLEQLLTNLQQEIDERKRIEEVLRESEQRYRGLFNNVPIGLYRSKPGARFIDVNRALVAMLGYPDRATLMATPTSEVLATAEDRARLRAAEQGYGARDLEISLRRYDGTTIYVNYNSHVVRDDQGKPVYYEGAVQDITERKQAEQQALDLAMERERVQILASFINKASHEFKTPLSIIGIKAHLLNKASAPDEKAEHLRQINEQIDGLATLIVALTTLSSLDSGMSLEFEVLDVNNVLRAMWPRLSGSAGKKQIMLTQDLDPALPPVTGDIYYLHQALSHLIDNALRYTPPGNAVHVRTSQAGQMVGIEICDTGIGIATHQRPHIFERFYRADEAHTTRGLGLGLPIARTIIELHGGQLEVESTPGQGSTFTAWLPVNGA